jgi:pyrroline-5-carboxylate reductase
MRDNIAFIGAGNMARSLVGGLLKSGVPIDRVVASDPDAAQRTTMAALGVATTASNTSAIDGAATIVLAVKPQAMRGVMQGLRSALRAEHLLISIAAGVPIGAIQRWSAPSLGIVRCMPNTPALYGAAVTALLANEHATPRQRTTAESTLAAVGRVIWVDNEAALDAVTAVSGSGPAYFFYLMEAMIAAGVKLGLDEGTARTLTLQTATGAALMAAESGLAPAQLRRNVTSPGGTTEAAIAVLEANRCQTVLIDALRQASNRSAELAVEFGAD